MADATLATRLHLGGLVVVAVEASRMELDVLCEMLLGFGVRKLARFRLVEEAQAGLRRDPIDLLFVGSVPGDPDEYGLTTWLRRDGLAANRTAPVVLLTGHTQAANVLRARDCGASIVLAKPVLPAVLFDRLAWLVRDRRAFIDVPSYAGPDRRFRKLGPPPGADGRRRGDLLPNPGDAAPQPGEAKKPSMPQRGTDALLPVTTG